MLTRSRLHFAALATLLAIGGLFVAGALTPQAVSADHDDYDFCDPYYDQFDDDCHHDDDFCDDDFDDDDDYYDCDDVFGGHNDDYAGFLSIVASPSTINCGSTTLITVDIGSYYYNGHYSGHYSHSDHYYGYGTTIALGVNVPGTISPATMQTAVNGRAVFSYMAPATYKGPVYITGSTEFLTSSLILQVNCNTANPSAPPISLAPAGGGIRPPNTGDGGLAASDGGANVPILLVGSMAVVTTCLYAARRLVRD
jgi:hypothetical protein